MHYYLCSNVDLWINHLLSYSDLHLLAFWGKTETELQREACPLATAPSPTSTRRESMETQDEQCWYRQRQTESLRALSLTHTLLALGILQRWSWSTWQVGNWICVQLHTCYCHPPLSPYRFYKNYKDYSIWSAVVVSRGPQTAVGIHCRNKESFNSSTSMFVVKVQ